MNRWSRRQALHRAATEACRNVLTRQAAQAASNLRASPTGIAADTAKGAPAAFSLAGIVTMREEIATALRGVTAGEHEK